MTKLDRKLCAEMAATCACFHFRKASRSVTQLFDQELAPTKLRSTQLVILIASYLLGPCSTARLARELVVERSTLTRNLRPLLQRNLLSLSRASNGKSTSIELTPVGRRALQEAVPYWERAQSRLVGSVGKRRWSQMAADLTDIVDATRTSEA